MALDLYLTDDQFNWARLRAVRTLHGETPYPSLDVEIIPYLNVANTIPGVASIFSCYGHERDADFYIVFGATAKGQANLQRVLLRALDRLIAAERASECLAFELVTGALVWPKDCATPYVSYTLCVRASRKRLALPHLMEALKYVANNP